ncbi:MAG: ribonuclease HII [Alphaproteobacteria bacterium]|nr:ribonuclease HII [Alphaproteobacteria bacterium]
MAICGIDEAGRGPWAGPVTAAAVILPAKGRPKGLADSKLLTEDARAQLATAIRACAHVGLGWASAEEIDALNIRAATHLAMQRALAALPEAPVAALIDGNDAPALGCPVEAIIDGDAHVACISAASIIAKVARDALMAELCAAHPGYGFAQHKGYGTPQHQAALARLGPCAIHRMSFKPVRAALAAPS